MSQTNLPGEGNKSVVLNDKDDINYQISLKSSVVANNWNKLMTLILHPPRDASIIKNLKCWQPDKT